MAQERPGFRSPHTATHELRGASYGVLATLTGRGEAADLELHPCPPYTSRGNEEGQLLVDIEVKTEVAVGARHCAGLDWNQCRERRESERRE